MTLLTLILIAEALCVAGLIVIVVKRTRLQFARREERAIRVTAKTTASVLDQYQTGDLVNYMHPPVRPMRLNGEFTKAFASSLTQTGVTAENTAKTLRRLNFNFPTDGTTHCTYQAARKSIAEHVDRTMFDAERAFFTESDGLPDYDLDARAGTAIRLTDGVLMSLDNSPRPPVKPKGPPCQKVR